MTPGRKHDSVGVWVDVVFLAVCIALGAFGLSNRAATPAKAQPHKTGDKIRVPGVDFSRSERTLLMFILNRQSTPQSLAFYAGLTAATRNPAQVRLIALVGEQYDLEASKAHLGDDGVVPDELAKTDLDALMSPAAATQYARFRQRNHSSGASRPATRIRGGDVDTAGAPQSWGRPRVRDQIQYVAVN